VKPDPSPDQRSGAPRHLVVKLRRGWRVSSRRGIFVGPDSPGEFDPAGQLPEGTRLEPMVPALAESDPSKLSEDEENLARYVNVVPPPGVAAEELVEKTRTWPCVREARLAPEVSLPDSPP